METQTKTLFVDRMICGLVEWIPCIRCANAIPKFDIKSIGVSEKSVTDATLEMCLNLCPGVSVVVAGGKGGRTADGRLRQVALMASR